MTVPNYLYCLTKYRSSYAVPASAELAERIYKGQLVAAGPDAALEIKGENIRGFVHGETSHPKGQLAELIDQYRYLILDAAESIRTRVNDTVIISGRWHHIDANQEPRFEAYLTHVIAQNGAVKTQRYLARIFDWDAPGLNDDDSVVAYLDCPFANDADELDRLARGELGDAARYTTADDLPAVDAILWFPEGGHRLPMVVSSVREDALPGDCTVLSALRDRLTELSSSPGVFRGRLVTRALHRPPELTLNEVLSTTDALGYWLQTDYGSGEPDSMFVFSRDPRRWADVVLKRLDEHDCKDTLSCQYASEWEVKKGMSTKRSRILAVGSIPDISISPL